MKLVALATVLVFAASGAAFAQPQLSPSANPNNCSGAMPGCLGSGKTAGNAEGTRQAAKKDQEMVPQSKTHPDIGDSVSQAPAQIPGGDMNEAAPGR